MTSSVLALTAVLSYRAFFRWLDPGGYVFLKTVTPLSQIALFSLLGLAGGARDPAYYLIGNSVVTVSISAVYWVAVSVSGERTEGTLEALIASPTELAVVFFGRTILFIVDAIVSVLVGLVFAHVFFGLHIPVDRWPPLLFVLLLSATATAGLGLLVGAVSLLVLDASFIANAVIFGLLLLSGANIPVEDLPSLPRHFAGLLPLTRSIAAARAVAQGGDLLSELGSLAAELGVGIMYALLAYRLFRWSATRARSEGTLDRF